MSTYPTTFADLESIGWEAGGGASGHRFRYTTVGNHEVGAFNDGGGVYVERADSEHSIDTADACILASKIAALLRSEIATNLAAALDERDVAHADFEASANDYEIVAAERDAARTEAETLRARLHVETEARRRAIAALASALIVDPNMVDANHLIEAASIAAGHIKAGTETVNRLDLAVSKLEADLSRALADASHRQRIILEAHAALDKARLLAGLPADRIAVLAGERDALRADLAKAITERDEVTSRCTALHNTIRRMSDALARAGFALPPSEAEAALDEAIAVIASREAERYKAQTENATLREQTKAAHDILDAAGIPPRGFIAKRITALAAKHDAACNEARDEREYWRAIAITAEKDKAKTEAEIAELRTERDAIRSELNRANMEALNAAASAPVYRHAVDQLRAYLSQRTGVDHTGADVVSAVVRELQGCGETVQALQERLDLAEKRITRAEDIALEQLRHRLRGT